MRRGGATGTGTTPPQADVPTEVPPTTGATEGTPSPAKEAPELPPNEQAKSGAHTKTKKEAKPPVARWSKEERVVRYIPHARMCVCDLA